MSNYLAQRLIHHERVTVHPRSELCGVHGTARLDAVTCATTLPTTMCAWTRQRSS
jgi:hypothetical protein